jgi:hypothetical protein
MYLTLLLDCVGIEPLIATGRQILPILYKVEHIHTLTYGFAIGAAL